MTRVTHPCAGYAKCLAYAGFTYRDSRPTYAARHGHSPLAQVQSYPRKYLNAFLKSKSHSSVSHSSVRPTVPTRVTPCHTLYIFFPFPQAESSRRTSYVQHKSTPVPIKFSKNAAMLIPMRVADALRTKGASTSRVHGFSSHTLFRLCFFHSTPRNSVAPNYFTSYLTSPVSSCIKVIAHHQAFHLFGTDVA